MMRVSLPALIVLLSVPTVGSAQDFVGGSQLVSAQQDSLFSQTLCCSKEDDLSCCQVDIPCGEYSQPCWMECNELWTRERLTNGFWGLQPAIAEHGIVYDAHLTQFYQGVANGGAEQLFEYGGKFDQFLIFEGEKLGLWKGFEVVMHAESRFGEDVIPDAAVLAPVNINMLYPAEEQITAITGLQFLQALNEDWAVTAGRINTLDLIQTLYPQTGRGIDGFMNTSTFLPLSLGVTVPLVFNGAGVLKMHDHKIEGGLLVLDPSNIPTVSGIDDMFSNGATVLGLWRLFTDVGGQPGSHLFAGSWSSSDYTSLDRHSWVVEPGVGIVPGNQTASWSLLYVLEQQIWADQCNPERNVGLLSEWGYADPDTSPYEWVCNVSLQANGLLRGRPADRLGVAWFYNGLSGEFRDLVSPVADLRDLTGVEAYYNAAITPWFHLTADLQVVEPADRRNRDTALVLGLRAKISL